MLRVCYQQRHFDGHSTLSRSIAVDLQDAENLHKIRRCPSQVGCCHATRNTLEHIDEVVVVGYNPISQDNRALRNFFVGFIDILQQNESLEDMVCT